MPTEKPSVKEQAETELESIQAKYAAACAAADRTATTDQLHLALRRDIAKWKAKWTPKIQRAENRTPVVAPVCIARLPDGSGDFCAIGRPEYLVYKPEDDDPPTGASEVLDAFPELAGPTQGERERRDISAPPRRSSPTTSGMPLVEIARLNQAGCAAVVAKLTAAQRRLVVLHLVDGTSLDVCADKLGCDPKRASRMMARIRLAFRDAGLPQPCPPPKAKSPAHDADRHLYDGFNWSFGNPDDLPPTKGPMASKKNRK